MTAPPAAVDGHTAPPDPAAEAVTPAMPPIATGKRILTGSKNTWQDPVKQTEARLKPPLLQQEGQSPPLQKPQEAARQPPQHPPGFLVWPAVLSPPPASGQESQVIARLTASGHASDSGKRATASGHTDLPGGQGNAYADGTTGSDQQTATSHAKSCHGVTGIDPRIKTGHVETESFTPRAVAVRRPRPLPARAGTRREPRGR